MIKKFLILYVFFLLPYVCYSDDISISFPNNSRIRDYVSCETKITSIRYEDTIMPSYELTLTKKRNNKIKELSLEIIYYYGQNFVYTNRKMFTLNDNEISMLNTNGQIVLTSTLPEMKREPRIVLENAKYYLAPDGEYVSDVFYKLLVEDKTSWNYNATSFLKEVNAEYSPNNLSSPDGLPWASANGYGIGDKIIIDMGAIVKESLIIINGFVLNERPDLFTANSRVKRIKLLNLHNGRSIIKNIRDSKAPQNIDIRNLNPSQNMRLEIEILSIYPGSKFRDLCIQAIF